MNSSNIYAIKMALIVFPLVAALFLIPYLIYQYRKHGSVVLFKAIVTYAFIYYLITAFFLVMLPLYPRSVVANMTTPYYDLEFLGFIKDLKQLGLLKVTDLKSFLILISHPRFLEPFFNVLLTIPFGIFLRYFFKREWWEVLLLTFLLSLFFEVTQLSGIYGFYSRPHRLFQIDDLMLNTLGGMTGYVMTPIFVFMFPTRDRLDEISEERSNNVGPLRRLVALLIDSGLILIFGIIVFKLMFPTVSIVVLLKSWKKYLKILISMKSFYVIAGIFSLIFFVLVPSLLDGATIGKRIVGIKLVNEDGSKIKISKLLAYYVINIAIFIYYYISLLLYFDKVDGIQLTNDAKRYYFIMVLIVSIIYIISTVYNLFSRQQTVVEVITKTKQSTKDY